jgi:hypothetical protein
MNLTHKLNLYRQSREASLPKVFFRSMTPKVFFSNFFQNLWFLSFGAFYFQTRQVMITAFFLPSTAKGKFFNFFSSTFRLSAFVSNASNEGAINIHDAGFLKRGYIKNFSNILLYSYWILHNMLVYIDLKLFNCEEK